MTHSEGCRPDPASPAPSNLAQQSGTPPEAPKGTSAPVSPEQASAIGRVQQFRDELPADIAPFFGECLGPLLDAMLEVGPTTYQKIKQTLRKEPFRTDFDDLLYELYEAGASVLHTRGFITHEKLPITEILYRNVGLPLRKRLIRQYGISDPVGIVLVDIFLDALIGYWTYSRLAKIAGKTPDGGLNLKKLRLAQKNVGEVLGQVIQAGRALGEMYEPRVALRIRKKGRTPDDPDREINIF